jgi:hypothetical protein
MQIRVFVTKLLVCGMVVPFWGVKAQDVIPLQPGSPHPNAGEKLDVEQIEVRRLGAIPNEIHRHAGHFLLLIVNRNPEDPNTAFVIDPAAIGDGKLGPSPLLRVGGIGINDRKHRSAGLFEGKPGEFDVKYADTGKIVCKIKID